MTKILFTNTNCSLNKGSAAQVISTCETLRELIPDLDITLISYNPEHDIELCNLYNIKVVSALWLPLPNITVFRSIYYAVLDWQINMIWSILFKLGLHPAFLKKSMINEYLEADAILDLSGDSYSDGKGGLSLKTNSTILLCVSLKRPIILYSQSIGPFRSIFTPLSKKCLNQVSMILVREEITKYYLEDLGIGTPMHLIADSAFVLKPPTHENVKYILLKEKIDIEQRPLIGITPNALTDDDRGNYTSIIAKVADYMVEEFDAQVVLIPHSIGPKIFGKDNDVLTGEKIKKLVNNKNYISLLHGNYSPNELKGIISLCEIFIGGRMHANIAAISSCVPTIATAWSHKFYGIMRSVGQEKYVLDYRTISEIELKLNIYDLWMNRSKIRYDLENVVEKQKELARLSGKIVKAFIDSSR